MAQQPSYNSTTNSYQRTDLPRTERYRFTTAQINAGATVLAAIPGAQYRVIDLQMIAIGGAASGATAVVVTGTRSAGSVTLLSVAVAALTQSSVVRAGAANATVLADGATHTALDANTAVLIGKTGGSLATATNIDLIITYVID